jgi:protein subunit release factor A
LPRQKILSVTKDDLIIQTFTAGGKGGQHQNKTASGVRIIHPASGARGEARDTRDQAQNKILAFQRIRNSPEFKTWLRLEIDHHLGLIKYEKLVDGKWITW